MYTSFESELIFFINVEENEQVTGDLLFIETISSLINFKKDFSFISKTAIITSSQPKVPHKTGLFLEIIISSQSETHLPIIFMQ